MLPKLRKADAGAAQSLALSTGVSHSSTGQGRYQNGAAGSAATVIHRYRPTASFALLLNPPVCLHQEEETEQILLFPFFFFFIL